MTVPLPPLPWTGLPQPPADPSQHLAFWQAVGRTLGVAGSPPDAVLKEARQSQRHKGPLISAVRAMDVTRVADLLDDPVVRTALLTTDRRNTDTPAHRITTALDVVLYRRVAHIMELLEGADDANPEGNAILDGAWARNVPLAQEAIVAMLLAAGAVPNAMAWLALGGVNTPGLVDRLMAAGHAPMHLDHPQAMAMRLGSTALHRVAMSGESHAVDVAQRLIAHGWRVNARDWEGRTPLHSAVDVVENGRGPMIATLLAHGATPAWLEHKQADHALIIAALGSNIAALDALLAHGQAHLLNVPAGNGLTPLNHALRAGHPQTADHLLARGAVPDAHSVVQAQTSWALADSGGEDGLTPLSPEDRACWSRLLVRLETWALRTALPSGPVGPLRPDAATTLPLPASRRRL